ncbi:MAG: protein kinase domain-containing protein [Limisphaerales bacterium]
MTENANIDRKCERCGAPLAADAPEGLCPRCLMALNLAAQTEAPGAEAGPSGTQVVPPKPEPNPPLEEIARQFPQLEVLECLGRGGMGVVYKARQPRLNRFVALKILAREKEKDPRFAERFTREAQALARLNHPNIVTVYDFGETNGLYYLLMEFVDGMSLRQLLQSRKLAPEEALVIVPSICEALQYAHEQGIVHRDIKPENILLDKQGRVKIADFGIAKLLGADGKVESLTGEQGVVGTPHYMAPEQVEKPSVVDHRADIFSLGVVFYEMLTGELPLGRFAPPSRMVKVDVRLDEVVLHALEKEPDRRYQHASQVKTDVETIATTSGAGTVPPPPPPLYSAAASPGAPLPPGTSATSPAFNSAVVTIPAIGLVVAGALKLLSALTAITVLGNLHHGWLGNLIGPAAPFLPFNNSLFSWSIGLTKAVPGLLMIYGGLQMAQLRSYAWSVAAGVLGIVACSLIGLPLGIWALIVLTRADVRQVFANPPAPQTARGGNWGWVWPATGALILLLVVGLVLLAIVGGARALLGSNGGQFRSGVKAYTAPEDTIETSSPVTATVMVETPSSGDHTDSMVVASPQATHRTVKSGSEANVAKSFAVGRDGKLLMDVDRGGIRVVGGDQDTVDVRVSRKVRGASGLDADQILAEEELVLTQTGNQVSIGAHEPPSLTHGSGWFWTRPKLEVKYEISVPRKCDLRLKTAGGGIKVAAIRGEADARTAGGLMDFDDVEGNVNAQTGGGGILAAGCKGQMVVKTEGGGITVEAFAGPSIQGTTDGGSITAEFAASPKLDSLLRTSGGSVTVRLPETAMISLDAHTGGGAVKTDLPVQSEGGAERSTMRGKINGGGPSLKLETSGGDINVWKR